MTLAIPFGQEMGTECGVVARDVLDSLVLRKSEGIVLFGARRKSTVRVRADAPMTSAHQ
jgi:hypothetical protein